MKKLKAERMLVSDLIKDCNEKLKADPRNLDVINLRGVLYIVAQEYDNAIAYLDTLIHNMPENETALYLRSNCYFSKGEYDLAKQDYLRALKIQFKDKVEFVKGYTEAIILKAKMNDEDEKATIKKILDYEKWRVFGTIPQLQESYIQN